MTRITKGTRLRDVESDCPTSIICCNLGMNELFLRMKGTRLRDRRYQKKLTKRNLYGNIQNILFRFFR